MRDMAKPVGKTGRIFKAALFAKAARKAGIADAAFCKAILQVMLGQADDLGERDLAF